MQIRKRSLVDCTRKSVVSYDEEEQRKIYCGNLSEKVTQNILFELFLQAGPVESVEIPKSKDGRLRNYAFITYAHVSSVPYAMQLFADIKLYNRNLVLRNRQRVHLNTNVKSTSKLTRVVVKEVNCVTSEHQITTRTRRQGKKNPVQEQEPIQLGQNNECFHKLNNMRSQLARIPLRASNDCEVPKNNQDSMNPKWSPNSIWYHESVIKPTISSTDNLNNLRSTFNLTSQFLNNYIYLMQKVIPHCPHSVCP